MTTLLVGCASERSRPSLPTSPGAAPAPVVMTPASTVTSGSGDAAVTTAADGQPTEESSDLGESFPRAFATVEALCADYLDGVAARRPHLEESAKFADVPLGRPSCRPSPQRLGVAFAGGLLYKRAFFVERSDGLEKELRVVVEIPRGLLPTAIAWDTVDPLDPGCPSIPRTTGLAALRVENGYLVATLRQELITYDEDGKTRTVPLLEATWCGDSAGTLRCRSYDSMNEPRLKRFEIGADGELVREG